MSGPLLLIVTVNDIICIIIIIINFVLVSRIVVTLILMESEIM